MKRLTWVFAVVLVLLVGWYFAWSSALVKVEGYVASQVSKLEDSADAKIDVHYTLKPDGFPFKAGYVLDNMSITLHEKETNHRATLSTKGYNFVYVSVFDFYKPLIGEPLTFETFTRDLEGVVEVESPEETVKVKFNIARSVGSGVLDKNGQYKGRLSDLDLYVSAGDIKDKRLLTVNQLSMENKGELTSQLLTSLLNLEVLGATLYDLEGENSFEIDQFKLGLNIVKLPMLEKSVRQFLQKMNPEEVSDKQRAMLSKKLIEYFRQMQQNKTKISLNDYQIKIDAFEASLKAQLSINEQLKPVGEVKILVENIAALNNIEGVNESPVNLSHFSGAEQSMEISFESDGKRIYMNGMPVMLFVPAFDVMIENFLGVSHVPDLPVGDLKNDVGVIDRTKEIEILEAEEQPVLDTETAVVPDAEDIQQVISLTAVEETDVLSNVSVSTTVVDESVTAEITTTVTVQDVSVSGKE